MYIQKILFFLLFQLSFSSTISGYIRENHTGEPLGFANIVLIGTNIGTASDIHGHFVIPNVNSGEYIIKVMMIGYESIEKEITIINKNERINFQLKTEVLESATVSVSANRMRFEKKIDISRVNLTNRDIRKAPAFIEADVFRTIQLLPSVSASNDFNAALIVRGGSPDENLIMLDGAQIYNPYHIGGVFSTFNSDMISDTEFLAGGFPAQYGGRLSSVLNITSREGDSKNGRLADSLNIYDVILDWPWHWPVHSKRERKLKKYWDYSKIRGDISLLSSKILIEGPLYNGSWMFSGRRTYFDKFVDLYYSNKDETSPFNYYFWDTHFKAKTSFNNNNIFSYSQFSGKDNLFMSLGGDDFPGIDFGWYWGNATNQLNWKFIPNSNYFIESNISNTQYKFNVDFSVDFPSSDTSNTENESSTADLTMKIKNIVRDISIDQNLNYIFTEHFKLKLGWESKYLYMDYREEFAGIERSNLNSKPQINSIYGSIMWNPFPMFHLNTGVRIADYNRYSKTMIDPRISIKYNPIPDLALKASWGEFTQYLYTINQEEELLRIVDFWQPIPENKSPQQAEHFIIGAEYWISEGNTFSIESYYKPYSVIYDLNPRVDWLDIENTLGIAGTGKAYGIELLYRLNVNKFSGWVSYAYSKMVREIDLNSDGIIWDEKEIYPAKYDKPHSFNSVISYKLSPKMDIGFSCVYGTGQTYTPVIGKTYQAGTENYGSLEFPYQYLGDIPGARNSARYPQYFRLDLSLSYDNKIFGFENKMKVQLINTTNYYNVLLYNWNHEASPSKVKAYSMFPIILTFGMEFEL
jgi:hypothetical protein